jgi:hypothetical protein
VHSVPHFSQQRLPTPSASFISHQAGDRRPLIGERVRDRRKAALLLCGARASRPHAAGVLPDAGFVAVLPGRMPGSRGRDSRPPSRLTEFFRRHSVSSQAA